MFKKAQEHLARLEQLLPPDELQDFLVKAATQLEKEAVFDFVNPMTQQYVKNLVGVVKTQAAGGAYGARIANRFARSNLEAAKRGAEAVRVAEKLKVDTALRNRYAGQIRGSGKIPVAKPTPTAQPPARGKTLWQQAKKGLAIGAGGAAIGVGGTSLYRSDQERRRQAQEAFYNQGEGSR